ncbi:GUN4 domain-containing protein [Dolichospermum sp. UHCC 0259]|uniref:GUN4 domain-containing protein n=1 Tax=Dolichospermum sp. UHCC 0259 TaxID=2590010 RepID=UPI00352B922C
MTNHSQQPGKYDAVLGGQHQTSEFAAVLGGIEGVKLGLSNPNPQVRIVSLKQALNYGESGLDLVIQSLNDDCEDVQNTAYGLLTLRTEAKVKEALRIFDNAQLKSDVGMNYSKLRDYLAQGKWKEADEETRRVMLAVAKREKFRLDDKSIDNFPCADLRTIDQLWVKYSDGKFGFSVQKRIYQSLGGTRGYNREVIKKFGDKVGWRKGGDWLYYFDITFDKKAPEGHLPALSGRVVFGLGYGHQRWDLPSLLSRRDL